MLLQVRTFKNLHHLYLLLLYLFVLWFNLLRAEHHRHLLTHCVTTPAGNSRKSRETNEVENLLKPIKSLVKVNNRLIRTGHSLPFKDFSISYFRTSLAQRLQAHTYFHTHLPRQQLEKRIKKANIPLASL